ncbi:GNAT family N-acetyltransferase [Streptomyces sp. NBC_01341]|uniref:GNAT family N-acetyltransferase n=1 Tax=Streptomyces sp. NBC_01341 TaxID=2903831 RepID=UPI002E153769|nr:GNAT family N-acetyltransferase [Streptomyces sp. NBC_01341]
MRVRLMTSGLLPAYADGIRRVYADVFSAPPWNEDPSAAGPYVERLMADALRPGFTAALALEPGTGAPPRGAEGPGPCDEVGGFATAWTTPGVFPTDRGYGHVARALGPGRVSAWLCGALEVDELAVSPAARGAGLGAALLTAVTGAAPDGRCWLLTSVHAEATLRFYRRAGWHPVPVTVPGRAGLTVLLGPGHPAAAGLAHW